MAKKTARQITRRYFVQIAATGVVGTAAGPFFVLPERARAQQKSLKILQWSHFVPGFDKWFDGVFAKQWGQDHNVNISVDHVTARDVNTRGAAEVSAGKGHDLFLFQFPPAAFEKHVIDLTDLYQEVERKHGKVIPLGHRSAVNPKTKKYFAFTDSYAPFPGNYRQDLWEQVGYPNGPDTYEDLRAGAKKIHEKSGNPCGIGLSQDNDTSSAVRAILWSFGASEQDENGIVTIHSKQTIQALKFAPALYQESDKHSRQVSSSTFHVSRAPCPTCRSSSVATLKPIHKTSTRFSATCSTGPLTLASRVTPRRRSTRSSAPLFLTPCSPESLATK